MSTKQSKAHVSASSMATGPDLLLKRLHGRRSLSCDTNKQSQSIRGLAKQVKQLRNDIKSLSAGSNPSLSLIGSYGTKLIFQMLDSSMDDGTTKGILKADYLFSEKIEKDLWVEYVNSAQNKFPDFVVILNYEDIVVRRLEVMNNSTGFKAKTLNPDKDLYPHISLGNNEISQLYTILQVQRNR